MTPRLCFERIEHGRGLADRFVFSITGGGLTAAALAVPIAGGGVHVRITRVDPDGRERWGTGDGALDARLRSAITGYVHDRLYDLRRAA